MNIQSAGQVLNRSGYAAKLADPRWASFAHSIRADRRNTCHSCRRSDCLTQVHHIFYEPDKEPWEYEACDVVLLCKSCHEKMHEELKKFRKHVFRNLSPQSFTVLNGALAVAFEQYEPLIFCHALAEFVSNERLVENHAKAWGMQAKKEAPVNRINRKC